MSKGNFKVMCVDNSYCDLYTIGKVYEFVNGKITYDDGSQSSASYNSFEDWDFNSCAKWELVSDNPLLTFYINNHNRLVGMLTHKGQKYFYSVNMSKANNDFLTAVYMVADKIKAKWAPEEVNPDVVIGEDSEPVVMADNTFVPPFDWSAFKSGKFAVHCDSKEQSAEFLKECDEQGITWISGGKATESNYGDTCYVHRRGNHGLTYGGKIDEVHTVDYIPSKPTVKEVHRPAKVGEWIKVTKNGYWGNQPYSIGEIYPIDRISARDRAYYHFGKSDELFFDISEYVVLENYQPEEQPSKEESNPSIKTIDDYPIEELFESIKRRCNH